MSCCQRPLLLLFAALALAQGGCAVLAVGAVGGGAAAYGVSRGTMRQTFDASVEATAVATQSALKDLGLPIERPRIGANFAEIDSTLPEGGAVILTLRSELKQVPSDPPRTRVDVHIKVFGDKKLSQRLLDQIAERLKNPASIAPAAAVTPAAATTTTTIPPPLLDQTDEPGLAPVKK